MCIHIVFLIKHLRGLLLDLNERFIQAVFENIRLSNRDSLKELSVKSGTTHYAMQTNKKTYHPDSFIFVKIKTSSLIGVFLESARIQKRIFNLIEYL